jgi:hypothetical protein
MNGWIKKINFYAFALILLWTANGRAEIALDLSLELPNGIEAIAWQDLLTEDERFSGIIFSAVVQSDRPVKGVYFRFVLQCTKGEVFRGNTRIFDLYEGITPFSNLDLTMPGATYRLNDFDATAEAKIIQREMQDVGYLPPGEYRLKVELVQPGKMDSVLAFDEAKITLKNPFDIELIRPRGTPSNPRLVSKDDLTFQWSSSAKRFILTIWEKPEIPNDRYRFDLGSPIYRTERSDPLNTKIFVFMEKDRVLLKAGRTYFWKVTSLVKTSSGIKEIDSPLGTFEIVPDANESAVLLAILRRIVGKANAEVWKEFSGFQPTGKIRVDGKWVTLDELMKMATDFDEGTCKILTVTFR